MNPQEAHNAASYLRVALGIDDPRDALHDVRRALVMRDEHPHAAEICYLVRLGVIEEHELRAWLELAEAWPHRTTREEAQVSP